MMAHAVFSMIPLVGIAWVFGLTDRLGINLYNEQILSITLSLAFLAIFLNAAEGRKLPAWRMWLDICLGLSGFLPAVYIAINYQRVLNELHTRPVDLMVCSALVIAVCLEATRRVAGLPLALVVCFFLLFGLFGHWVPGELAGRQTDFDMLVTYLAGDSNSMLGLPLAVTVNIIIAFILFGVVLEKTGGGKYFTDLSLSRLGKYTGGGAKIAITASALFGSISGSAVANVAATGVVTIPLMRKTGYRPEQAAAIEGIASTGGQLAPPIMGAAAFLMAEALQIPYQQVAIAALIPACLYYFSLYIQVDLMARRDGIRPLTKAEIPVFGKIFFAGLHYLAAFIMLIIALFVFKLSPGEAALYCSVFLLVVQLLPRIGQSRYRVASFGDFIGVLSAAGKTCATIIIICASAGMIIGILNISTLGFALTLSLLRLTGQNLAPLLIMAAGLSIVLGMGMPTVGVYVLLGTLVAPAIIEAGATPIGAHLFVLYFGMMSMITPPVAIAAFAAAAIAGTRPMLTAGKTMLMGWTAYIIPFLFVVSPALLMQDSAFAIAKATMMSILGILFITVGYVGHFFGQLLLWMRAITFVTGLGCLLGMLYPAFGIAMGLAGITLLILCAIWGKLSHTASQPLASGVTHFPKEPG